MGKRMSKTEWLTARTAELETELATAGPPRRKPRHGVRVPGAPNGRGDS